MDTNQRLAKIIIKLAKKKQQMFYSSTVNGKKKPTPANTGLGF